MSSDSISSSSSSRTFIAGAQNFTTFDIDYPSHPENTYTIESNRIYANFTYGYRDDCMSEKVLDIPNGINLFDYIEYEFTISSYTQYPTYPPHILGILMLNSYGGTNEHYLQARNNNVGKMYLTTYYEGNYSPLEYELNLPFTRYIRMTRTALYTVRIDVYTSNERTESVLEASLISRRFTGNSDGLRAIRVMNTYNSEWAGFEIELRNLVVFNQG